MPREAFRPRNDDRALERSAPAVHRRLMIGLDGFDLGGFVAATLAEDLGERGDITSAAVIPADARFEGVMRTREPIVVAGLPVAEAFFTALDPEAEVQRVVDDGAAAEAGDILLRVSGRARALLAAERS